MDGSMTGCAQKSDVGQAGSPLAEQQWPKMMALEYLVEAKAKYGLWHEPADLARGPDSGLAELFEFPGSERGMAFASTVHTVDEPAFEDVSLVGLRVVDRVVLRRRSIGNGSDGRDQIADRDGVICVPLPHLLGTPAGVRHPLGRGRRVVRSVVGHSKHDSVWSPEPRRPGLRVQR